MVLGGSDTVAVAAYHAAPRLQPPLVSFIALFGGIICDLLRLSPFWQLRLGSARR